jgi:hypothetical protein
MDDGGGIIFQRLTRVGGKYNFLENSAAKGGMRSQSMRDDSFAASLVIQSVCLPNTAFCKIKLYLQFRCGQ